MPNMIGDLVKTGILVQVDMSGVGVIEESGSKNKFAFTFDKVKGYFGQSLAECGLMPGNRVKFVANEQRVESLEVVVVSNPSKPSSISWKALKGNRRGGLGA